MKEFNIITQKGIKYFKVLRFVNNIGWKPEEYKVVFNVKNLYFYS